MNGDSQRLAYQNIFTLSERLLASGSYLLDVPTVTCDGSSI